MAKFDEKLIRIFLTPLSQPATGEEMTKKIKKKKPRKKIEIMIQPIFFDDKNDVSINIVVPFVFDALVGIEIAAKNLGFDLKKGNFDLMPDGLYLDLDKKGKNFFAIIRSYGVIIHGLGKLKDMGKVRKAFDFGMFKIKTFSSKPMEAEAYNKKIERIFNGAPEKFLRI